MVNTRSSEDSKAYGCNIIIVHYRQSGLHVQVALLIFVACCNGVNSRPHTKESLMVARLNDIQGSGANVPQPETAPKMVAILMNSTV
jgi:hypothetical protein